VGGGAESHVERQALSNRAASDSFQQLARGRAGGHVIATSVCDEASQSQRQSLVAVALSDGFCRSSAQNRRSAATALTAGSQPLSIDRPSCLMNGEFSRSACSNPEFETREASIVLTSAQDRE